MGVQNACTTMVYGEKPNSGLQLEPIFALNGRAERRPFKSVQISDDTVGARS